MSSLDVEHFCSDVSEFPINKFLQLGSDKGQRVLIVGEAPAPNGWRKSGRAFYTTEGKLLPTGKNLNGLLRKYDLSVEQCGFTELVKCYVGKDRNLLSSCGEKCWPIFERQLAEFDFKFLITLGMVTLAILSKQLNQELLIGRLASIRINKVNYSLLPIYHPSPINPINQSRNRGIFDRLSKNQFARLCC